MIIAASIRRRPGEKPRLGRQVGGQALLERFAAGAVSNSSHRSPTSIAGAKEAQALRRRRRGAVRANQ